MRFTLSHLCSFRRIQADRTLRLFDRRDENLDDLIPRNEIIRRKLERTIVKTRVRLHDELTIRLQVLLLVEVVSLSMSRAMIGVSVSRESATPYHLFGVLGTVIVKVEQMIQILLLATMIKDRIQLAEVVHQSGGRAR